MQKDRLAPLRAEGLIEPLRHRIEIDERHVLLVCDATNRLGEIAERLDHIASVIEATTGDRCHEHRPSFSGTNPVHKVDERRGVAGECAGVRTPRLLVVVAELDEDEVAGLEL